MVEKGTIFKITLLILWIVLMFYLYRSFFSPKVKKPVPKNLKEFTPEELAKFDGSDPETPIYICVLGKIYDVTAGRSYYGKGSGYNIFAGRCASRAFFSGCFDQSNPDCLSDKVDDLTEEQMKSITHWSEFYENSSKYHLIGILKKNKE